MLSINISELIWTIVNFFLLLFLLKRFLYQPICEHMDARQARIDAGLEQERQAKAALQAIDESMSQQQQSAREEGRALLQRTEEEAERESAAAIQAAKRQVRQAEGEKQEKMQELSRQEHARLAEAEPALAGALARSLLGEEGDGE